MSFAIQGGGGIKLFQPQKQFFLHKIENGKWKESAIKRGGGQKS